MTALAHLFAEVALTVVASPSATYVALRHPRLRFVNIGDPPSVTNRHGQAYWIADPSGSPVPDYELCAPQYVVAHASPMNDPGYRTSFRAVAPDGGLLTGEVTYARAVRAAQRHYLRHWLLSRAPRIRHTWARPLWPHLRPDAVPSGPPEHAAFDDSDDIPF